MAGGKTKTGGNEPITRHPLFPAIVALWFGAIFGLISIVISPSLLERGVLAFGIDRVIPMAAPPLGTTTRILLALTFTGVGSVVGFFFGRNLAKKAPATSRPSAPGKTPDPFDPSQDILIDGQTRIPGRRRAIALKNEPASTALPLSDSPLAEPTKTSAADLEARILNVAEFDITHFDADAEEALSPVVGASAAKATEDTVRFPAWLEAETAKKPVAANTLPESSEDDAVDPIGTKQAENTLSAKTYDLTASHKRSQAILDAHLPANPEPGFKLLPRTEQQATVSTPHKHDFKNTETWDIQAIVESMAQPANTITEEPSVEKLAELSAPAFHPAPNLEVPTTAKPALKAPLSIADLESLSLVELLERLALATTANPIPSSGTEDILTPEPSQEMHHVKAPRPPSSGAEVFSLYGDKPLSNGVNSIPQPSDETALPESQSTEKALRDALATLKRMSGAA